MTGQLGLMIGLALIAGLLLRQPTRYFREKHPRWAGSLFWLGPAMIVAGVVLMVIGR